MVIPARTLWCVERGASLLGVAGFLDKKGTLGAGPSRNSPGLLVAHPSITRCGGSLKWRPHRSGLLNLFLKPTSFSPLRAFDSLRLDEGVKLSGGCRKLG